jgi:hypothetical protein
MRPPVPESRHGALDPAWHVFPCWAQDKVIRVSSSKPLTEEIMMIAAHGRPEPIEEPGEDTIDSPPEHPVDEPPCQNDPEPGEAPEHDPFQPEEKEFKAACMEFRGSLHQRESGEASLRALPTPG